MPAKPSKRPKTLSKADAEAAAAHSLRKTLGREPTADELAKAVGLAMKADKHWRKVIEDAIERGRKTS